MEATTKKDQKLAVMANGTHGQRDKDIITARRIDWRFLLPFPALHHVVYIGPPNKALTDALEQFSYLLKIIKPSELPGAVKRNQNRFSLAVVHTNDPKIVRKTIPLIAPGGLLYWEVDRRNQNKLAALLSLRNAKSYENDLRRMYLKDIDVYWHRPDFENCLEIIPLHDSQALKGAFMKSHTSWKGRLKITFGKLLMRTGLLHFTVPCFSFVARKRN